MQLTGDIELKHPLWQRADDELRSSRQLGIFNRLIDIYVLACAVGIKDDQVIRDNEIVDPLDNKSIGRNTHLTNEDIRCLMEFMLQNALIKSQTINLDRDERLKLAFDPDYSINKLTAASFLTGFANYGKIGRASCRERVSTTV